MSDESIGSLDDSEEVEIMTIVKIPRRYLIAEDQDSITLDLPESIVKQLRQDYSKVKRAQGILSDRKTEMLNHLAQIR